MRQICVYLSYEHSPICWISVVWYRIQYNLCDCRNRKTLSFGFDVKRKCDMVDCLKSGECNGQRIKGFRDSVCEDILPLMVLKWNTPPSGTKWSAVPLPCLTITSQIVGFKFFGLEQGSGPGRGQSPVEWGDFPSVRPFVRPSICSFPPGRPWAPQG